MHKKAMQQMGLQVQVATEYLKSSQWGDGESNRNVSGLGISSSDKCPSHKYPKFAFGSAPWAFPPQWLTDMQPLTYLIPGPS